MKVLAILLFCGLAHAGELPLTSLGTDPTPYRDAKTAAVHALKAAAKMPPIGEYGGVVLQCEGKYLATEPVTQGDTGEVHYQITLPAGCELVALYHTHPWKQPQSVFFSPTDTAMAVKLGVPSYIVSAVDGCIREFIPGRDRMQLPVGSHVYRDGAAAGRFVRSNL